MMTFREVVLLVGSVGTFFLVLAIVGGLVTLPASVAGPVDDAVNATDSAIDEIALGASDLNETRTEQLIHGEVNEERRSRGLSAINYRQDVAAVAAGHSRDMRSKGYFAHTSPSGVTMEDRYRRAGINCRASGENIAQTYAFTDVQTSYGAVVSSENESELAANIVEGWMHSEGHRENILRPRWNSEGIGVNISTTEDGETIVYATQNFCGS